MILLFQRSHTSTKPIVPDTRLRQENGPESMLSRYSIWLVDGCLMSLLFPNSKNNDIICMGDWARNFRTDTRKNDMMVVKEC